MTEIHAELETAQRYAAEQLSLAETRAFEAHLLTCAQCQDEVRLGVGVREITRTQGRTANGGHPTATTQRRTLRRAWGTGAGLLIAASVVGILLMSRGPDRELVALGRVSQPPEYRGVTARALPRRGDTLFAAAMTAYVAGDYGAAAGELRGAVAAGVDSVPATFWLASSHLMMGSPRAAESGYARVIAAGRVASPYLAEAHLFRARALLQLGRGEDALAELALVEGERRGAAAALSDSVTRVLQR
jgi:TolA-binding protein